MPPHSTLTTLYADLPTYRSFFASIALLIIYLFTSRTTSSTAATLTYADLLLTFVLCNLYTHYVVLASQHMVLGSQTHTHALETRMQRLERQGDDTEDRVERIADFLRDFGNHFEGLEQRIEGLEQAVQSLRHSSSEIRQGCEEAREDARRLEVGMAYWREWVLDGRRARMGVEGRIERA